MSATHTLKIHPKHYKRVKDGQLPGQIRYNDRNYHSGDIVVLNEWTPDELGNGGKFSGECVHQRINRVFDDLPGLMPGYVLFTTLPVVNR